MKNNPLFKLKTISKVLLRKNSLMKPSRRSLIFKENRLSKNLLKVLNPIDAASEYELKILTNFREHKSIKNSQDKK